MKRNHLAISFLTLFFLFASAAAAPAAGRYYSSHYSRHYYHKQYHHHSNYHYSSSDFWAFLGIGILTGIIVGTIINQPVPEYNPTYNSSNNYNYQRQPVTVHRESVPQITTQEELILKTVKTTAGLLNVRSLPSPEAPVTRQLTKGGVLGVIGAAPGWLYVRLPSGKYGWVDDKFTVEVEGPSG